VCCECVECAVSVFVSVLCVCELPFVLTSATPSPTPPHLSFRKGIVDTASLVCAASAVRSDFA
jgi:hypothetical protein